MDPQRHTPEITVQAPDAVDVRVTVAPDVHLHVRRYAPTGPPRRDFLLVHGLSSNALLWGEVAEALAEAGHPVAALDLRSHGTSDAPDQGYDTATAADDVAAVASALGISDALVVGQSWGGNIVVDLAGRHPRVAAGIALVDGGWIDLPAEFPSWEACEARLRPPVIDETRADDMRRYLRNAHSDWSDRAIDATLANLTVAPDGTVRRRLSIPRHLDILRSMWDAPPGETYARITVPALLIPVYPLNPGRAAERRCAVEAAVKKLPDATVREYVGGDHDLHAQHPRELAADLLDLAERVGPVR